MCPGWDGMGKLDGRVILDLRFGGARVACLYLMGFLIKLVVVERGS